MHLFREDLALALRANLYWWDEFNNLPIRMRRILRDVREGAPEDDRGEGVREPGGDDAGPAGPAGRGAVNGEGERDQQEGVPADRDGEE